MKHSVTKAMLAALAAGFANAAAAYGQITCGAVVTSNVVMTADMFCILNSPAFTIDGGSVDMNGHQVGCLPGSNGVLFINSGGKLKNGTVEGCDDGVILAGSGKHAVTNVMARGGQRGFVSTSTKNKLVRNSALDNSGDGFVLASVIQPMAHNLNGNVSANNGGRGFALTGDGSKLSGNLAFNNGGEGVYILGDGNKLSRSTAYDNGGIGVSVQGVENSLTQNSSIGNASWGFAPYGEAAKVKGNLALDNTGAGFGAVATGNAFNANMSAFNTQDGFVLFGDGTTISRSTAIGNAEDGILIGLAQANMVVKGNRVIANGLLGINLQSNTSAVTGNFGADNAAGDADDLSATCDTNVWKKNVFDSAADACIE
jgi:hypothetical protein